MHGPSASLGDAVSPAPWGWTADVPMWPDTAPCGPVPPRRPHAPAAVAPIPRPDPIDAWSGTLGQPPPAPEEEDDPEKPTHVATSVCLVTYSFLRYPLQ